MQLVSGIFDVVVFVLARSAFCSQQTAAVDLPEIAIRKLISTFGILGLLVVDPQIPFRILIESMSLNKIIFVLRRRLVFAPVVPFVVDALPLRYQFFGVFERSQIEFHCHRRFPYWCAATETGPVICLIHPINARLGTPGIDGSQFCLAFVSV
jgi:hypothetical protein